MGDGEPNPAMIRALVGRICLPRASCVVERVAEGVSTHVYRIRRGSQILYLRILPEAGASFAPEVHALELLRERGVLVPRVLYFEHCDAALVRSVMLTTEIVGQHVGRHPLDEGTRRVLIEAGRQLALINAASVDGFGWIKRDRSVVTRLEAEHPTFRSVVEEHLDADLSALGSSVLARREVDAIRAIIDERSEWLDADRACLAHGDFDVTAIFEKDGYYTGIIDFGEIRGADRWYDLGHFRMHDGETLPTLALDWLLEGYCSVVPLDPDYSRRISFASLLIAVRALARRLERDPGHVRPHYGLISLERDLAALRA